MPEWLAKLSGKDGKYAVIISRSKCSCVTSRSETEFQMALQSHVLSSISFTREHYPSGQTEEYSKTTSALNLAIRGCHRPHGFLAFGLWASTCVAVPAIAYASCNTNALYVGFIKPRYTALYLLCHYPLNPDWLFFRWHWPVTLSDCASMYLEIPWRRIQSCERRHVSHSFSVEVQSVYTIT